MHVRRITAAPPSRADLRSNLELLLLFMDVISAAIGIVTKSPAASDNGHDDDDHHGHTH